MEKMKSYHWPSNIRELENLIEREVLLTRDDTINTMALPTMPAQAVFHVAENGVIQTMSENERAHILSALKKCNGKI
jgi:DNA-binding NtrC family response regulator